MAEVDVSPSNHGKPVVVRVKRKLFQSPLEAFWLEINERPLKRQNLDFAKLSISESQSTKEELNPSKVLVRHVETVTTADDSLHLVLQSVMKNSDFERKTKVDKRKKLFMDTKQDKLLSKGKHEQEQLAKTARFEQIWRSRKGNRESTNEVLLQKACRLYDVVRVDAQGPSKKVQKSSDSSVEDYVNLNKYLPLMREIIPTAAEEVESDIRAYMSSKASGDDYVYDIYAVEEEGGSNLDVCTFPLVRVDEDDDFDNGLSDSEYDTDDSNAEGNPLHDYPDEETSEEEEEGSKKSDEESEESEPESDSGSKESLGSEYNKDVCFEEDDADDDGHAVYDSLDDGDYMEDQY